MPTNAYAKSAIKDEITIFPIDECSLIEIEHFKAVFNL